MNETTPPNEIPPFHSAAAKGTLPMEQTKLMMAMNGPTMTFSTLVQNPWPCRKIVFQNDAGHQDGEEPGDGVAEQQLATDHGEVGHGVRGGVRPAPLRSQFRAPFLGLEGGVLGGRVRTSRRPRPRGGRGLR